MLVGWVRVVGGGWVWIGWVEKVVSRCQSSCRLFYGSLSVRLSLLTLTFWVMETLVP